MRLVILLPPSEGKAPAGDGPPLALDGPLGRHRGRVARAAAAAMRSRRVDSAELLGVKGVALAAADAANRAILESPTRPALDRYTGVLYDALGPLDRRQRARAAESVLVVSGLMGVVHAEEPVPDYKLPIGASLPPLGRLATWWRPRVSPVINDLCAGAVVWDLLPGAHAAAWAPDGRAAAHWRVRVQREVDGRRTTVSHDNKATKGALARQLLTTPAARPGELDGWESHGYRVVGESHGVVDVVGPGPGADSGHG